MKPIRVARVRRLGKKFGTTLGNDPHTQRLLELETLIKTIQNDTLLPKQEKLNRIARIRDSLNEELHREWKEMHGM